jgi:hypothetical protein
MKTGYFLTRAMALLILFAASVTPLCAQTKRKNAAAEFTLPRAEFDKLYAMETGQAIVSPATRLHKGKIMLNTKNGDMQFVRVKLASIPHAYLVVQVNGVYTTQTFVLSDNHSISYKGSIGEREVRYTRCDEDEIVSE